MYYIYMIRCKDNSIYTGITTDLKRRLAEHQQKTEKCAKYTQFHTAIKIEAAWKTENRKLASQLEYRIKQLKKSEKEKLIQDNSLFEDFFLNKLEEKDFERVLDIA